MLNLVLRFKVQSRVPGPPRDLNMEDLEADKKVAMWKNGTTKNYGAMFIKKVSCHLVGNKETIKLHVLFKIHFNC